MKEQKYYLERFLSTFDQGGGLYRQELIMQPSLEELTEAGLPSIEPFSFAITAKKQEKAKRNKGKYVFTASHPGLDGHVEEYVAFVNGVHKRIEQLFDGEQPSELILP